MPWSPRSPNGHFFAFREDMVIRSHRLPVAGDVQREQGVEIDERESCSCPARRHSLRTWKNGRRPLRTSSQASSFRKTTWSARFFLKKKGRAERRSLRTAHRAGPPDHRTA